MVDVDGDLGDPGDLLLAKKVGCAPAVVAPDFSSADFLPVLDIRDWRRGGPTSDAFASALRHACATSGVLYVSGHGLEYVLEAAQRSLLEFFEAPRDVKAKVAVAHNTNVHPKTARGWLTNEDSVADSTGRPDRKESLDVGLERPAVGAPESRPYSGPNLWLPDDLPTLEPTLMAAVAALHALAIDLVQAVTVGLGEPRDALSSKCATEPMIQCRGLYYRGASGTTTTTTSAAAGSDDDDIGCAAHTDAGLIAVRHQTAAGLQVRRAADNAWVDAPPLPNDALVITVGDLLERWTNDRLVSAVHRVRAPPRGTARQSIGFVLDADVDARIETLPSCVPDGETAKYDAVLAGEHKLAKLQV